MRLLVWLTHREVACFDLTREQARKLADRLPGVDVRVVRSEAAFLDALPRADAAIVWRFDDAWLAHAPRLRWIGTPAASREWVEVAPRDGLRVVHGTFHGEIIAETVVGMLLSQARGLREADLLRTVDPWPRRAVAARARTLRGTRAVVLGFGHIGRWIARRLAPFGVRITGIVRRIDRPPEFSRDAHRIAGVEELDATLAGADWLILALPATRETDAIIDARRLALLPARATVVNVGRGNAIDEVALADALERGTLAAAWLDVFREEPLALDSPLRHARNAFLMPHASATAPDYLDLFIEEIARDPFFRDAARDDPYESSAHSAATDDAPPRP